MDTDPTVDSPVDAVDAVDVTKRYGDLVAVDHLSMRVAQGEIYGILGPNGAGKTTFLRMLFGLIRPDSGSIRLFGRTWAEAGVDVLVVDTAHGHSQAVLERVAWIKKN
ncbi:MAG TPA: hypothetical protein DEQ43_14205, partial [Nocardioides bacterium]|nr:hypothetical protein [Nocardioides sp.]